MESTPISFSARVTVFLILILSVGLVTWAGDAPEGVSREVSVFLLAEETGAREGISREVSLFLPAQESVVPEGISREVSVYLPPEEPLTTPEAISREISVFLPAVDVLTVEAISREVSLFIPDPLPPPAGLIAWWPGEDSALDFAGTNHGVTLSATAFHSAIVGNGFHYEQAADYTQLPDVTHGMPVGTLEGWVRTRHWEPKATVAGQYFWAVSRELPGASEGFDGMNLGSHPASSAVGELMFGIFDTNAPSALWHWAKSGLIPEVDRWYHVAASWGDQGIRLYIDGQLKGSDSYTGPAPSFTRYGIIGRSSWPGSSCLGDVDELKIFNRALTPAEIAALYNAGASGINKTLTPPYFLEQPLNLVTQVARDGNLTSSANGAAPLTYRWFFQSETAPTNNAAWILVAVSTNGILHFDSLEFANAGRYYVQVSNILGVTASRVVSVTLTNPICMTPPSGLVGWWPGDGNASDVVGSNHGTLRNGAAYATGKTGQAFNLDGFNDYVDLGASPSLDFVNSSFTAMAWIYLTGSSDNSNDEGIMSRYSISGGSWILGRFRDGKVWFGLDTDGGWALERSVWAAQVTSTGAWHHVAGAYNHSTGMLRLYVDGQSSGTNDGAPVTIYQSFESKVTIGAWYSYDGFNGSTALRGLIDEVALFSSALQPEEIAAIYAAGSAGMCKPRVPPSIVSQPTNVTVFATTPATFHVQALGDEPLRYQWRFNGGALASGTNATLTLPSVQASMDGAYDVIVSNPLGSVTSVVATLTVRTDIPDLALRSLLFPTNALAGQTVPLVVSVTNQGSGPALAPWVNTISLATNANGDGVLPLGSFPENVSLPSGTSIALTQTVIVPFGLSGAWYPVFTVNSDSHVFETNRANNSQVAATPMVITAPDLEMALLTVPSNGIFGQPLTVTWVVRNRGTGSTFANWSDAVFLSPVSGTVMGVTPLGSAPAKRALAPGQSYTNTLVVMLPLSSDLLSGTNYLVLHTDVGNTQPEPNEFNNLASGAIPLTLPPLPDLVIGSLSTPTIVSPGGTIAAIWNVTNRGPATASGTWTETLRIVSDEVTGVTNAVELQRLLTSAPTLGTFAYSNTLAPGEFLSRTQLVTLPVSGVSGKTRLLATVDARDEVFEEWETNNLSFADNDLTIPVSLTLQLSSSQISENATAPLRATLTRNGSLTQALTVTVTNSDPSELSFAQGLLTSAATNITIPAGQSVVVFDIYAVADRVVDGNQSVTLTASATGYDSASATVTVLNVDLPTLTLSVGRNAVTEGFTTSMTVTRDGVTSNLLNVALNSSSPGQLSPPNFVTLPAGANSVTFAVLAVDDANAEAAATYSISASAGGFNSGLANVIVLDNDVPQLTVSLSTHSISEGSGPQALSMTVTREPVGAGALNIEPIADNGTILTLPLRIAIPPGQASRSFPVGVIDDTEVNGQRSVVLSAYALAAGSNERLSEAIPDVIKVTDDDGPTLQLVAALKLVREGQNPATILTVTRNTPATNSLIVNLASSRTNEALVPATVTLSNSISSITFPLLSVADGTNDGNQTVTLTAAAPGFTEGVETVIVSDTDLPDLLVSSITAPASGVPQQRVGIGWRVVNQGVSTAAGEFLTRVYASGDAVVGGDDVLVAQFRNTNAVGVRQFIESTEQIELPLAVGNYWIVVETDSEQTVEEVLENNNIRISAGPIAVAADYGAWVQTDTNSAPANTSVPLYGRATNSLGAPVSGKVVNIHVLVRGTQRIISAITDATGGFTTTFTPLPNEAGRYELFATHPGVSTAPVQDTYSLLGFRANPSSVSLTVVESLSRSGSLTLENLSDVSLTGLAVEVVSKPTNLNVTTSLDSSELATHTSLHYSFMPTTADAYGTVQLRVTSAEGVSQDVLFGVSVEPLRPRLVATPVSLYAAMPVGGQAVVEFDVVNLGGRDSGHITVSIPAVPWMHIATTNPMPSLARGQTNRVTLVLTPATNLVLGPYTGSLAISADNSGTSVPFNFRAMSESVGSLLVDVVDEFTYYAEGAPHLAGASVTVRDSVTQASVTNGVTGIDGQFFTTNLNEGYYDIEVTADKHTSYRATHLLKAGITNQVQSFVSRQTVTYTWTVEPVQIEDRYRLVINTTFEANVPAPAVTLEPALIDLRDIPADAVQVVVKVTNHGLVGVGSCALQFPDHPHYRFTPLVENVGALPARTTISIPVLIERLTTSSSSFGSRQALLAGGGRSASQPVPCELTASFKYCYQCGGQDYCQLLPLPLLNLSGNCGIRTDPNSGTLDFPPPIVEIPNPEDVPSILFVIKPSNQKPVDCEPCYRLAFENCILGFVPLIGCGYSGAYCVANPTALNCLGAAAGCFGGPAGNLFACYLGFCSCPGFSLPGGSLCSTPWLNYNPFASILSPPNSFRAAGGDQPIDLDVPLSLVRSDDIHGHANNTLIIYSFTKFILFNDTNNVWFRGASEPNLTEWLNAFGAYCDESSQEGASLSLDERLALLQLPSPESVTHEDINRFVDRWNRTRNYWDSGIFEPSAAPPGGSLDFISKGRVERWQSRIREVLTYCETLGFSNPLQAYASRLPSFIEAKSQGGICARVKLRLEQDAVHHARRLPRHISSWTTTELSRLENVRVDGKHTRPESGTMRITNLFDCPVGEACRRSSQPWTAPASWQEAAPAPRSG
jgi:hypothetical protein